MTPKVFCRLAPPPGRTKIARMMETSADDQRRLKTIASHQPPDRRIGKARGVTNPHLHTRKSPEKLQRVYISPRRYRMLWWNASHMDGPCVVSETFTRALLVATVSHNQHVRLKRPPGPQKCPHALQVLTATAAEGIPQAGSGLRKKHRITKSFLSVVSRPGLWTLKLRRAKARRGPH